MSLPNIFQAKHRRADASRCERTRPRQMTWMVMICAVALLVAASAPAGAADPIGWTVNQGTTPLTGAKLATAVLPSTDPLTDMIGQPERAELVLRCQDGVLAGYVAWPEVLNIDLRTFSGRPQTMVLWRLDDKPIAVNFWMRADGGTAAGMFDTKASAKLIEKLVGAHKLVVRLTGRTTQDAVFELGDIVAVATRCRRST